MGRELIAAHEAAGERLDRYLADHAGLPSRAAAERLIERGGVRVDGERAHKALRLAGGELIEFEEEAAAAPAGPEPGSELEIPLALIDDDVIVADKPAGRRHAPCAGRRRADARGRAARRSACAVATTSSGPASSIASTATPRACSCCPAATAAYESLGEQMRARRIEREYIALVRGRPPSRRGTIDAPIGRDRNDVGRMAVGGRAERSAVTHFELAEPLAGMSLLRLKLETGRTHQIRVHLAAIGHPVLGDPTYGVSGAQIGLGRQFLHAARLGFEHPADGHRVELTSELPPDLAEALERARAAG